MRTLLLNLVLLLVLLPGLRQEARGASAIYFLGEALDKAEEFNSNGVGKATWDPGTKTLTLENFHEQSVSSYGGL